MRAFCLLQCVQQQSEVVYSVCPGTGQPKTKGCSIAGVRGSQHVNHFSLYVCVCVSLSLCVCLSLCLSLSVCLCVCLCLCLPVCLCGLCSICSCCLPHVNPVKTPFSSPFAGDMPSSLVLKMHCSSCTWYSNLAFAPANHKRFSTDPQFQC